MKKLLVIIIIATLSFGFCNQANAQENTEIVLKGFTAEEEIALKDILISMQIKSAEIMLFDAKTTTEAEEVYLRFVSNDGSIHQDVFKMSYKSIPRYKKWKPFKKNKNIEIDNLLANNSQDN